MSLLFADFAQLYVYVHATTSLQIGLHVRQFVLHGVVGVRLGFLRFQEVFVPVNAVLCVWLQSPPGRESSVLSDCCVRFVLALRLLSPVLILSELFFGRTQVRRQSFDFCVLVGTECSYFAKTRLVLVVRRLRTFFSALVFSSHRRISQRVGRLSPSSE